jgi:ribosomal protein S18 acetylase RimI-like enzyme
MDSSIRVATPGDTETIVQFNSCMALETEERTLDTKILKKGVEAILRDTSKGFYFVAEYKGRVIGQLMITYEWSDWRNGTFWWIQSVYIEKDFRQQGVFKALFKYVENAAKASKSVCGIRLYVEESNRQAQETYKRLGMKKTSYDLFEIDFVLK